jgi:hypothetical protein
MKGVYDITKQICKEKPKQLDSVNDKNGKLLTQRNRCKTEMEGTVPGSAK